MSPAVQAPDAQRPGGQPARERRGGRRRLSGAARPVRALPIIGAALVVGVLMVFAASRDLLRPLISRGWSQAPATGAVVTPEPLPVPRPAEVALSRARDLYRSGHLKAALAALGDVPPADPLAAEAAGLAADIQRILLEPSAGPAVRAEVRR
jgi:hypothetical protein